MARIILIFLAGAAMISCKSPNTISKYEIGPDRRAKLVARYPGTEDDLWKETVNERISKEMRGEPAEAGHSSWATYWPSWYSNIREGTSPPWKSSEFKTVEDMVAYIKKQRAAKRLPPYD